MQKQQILNFFKICLALITLILFTINIYIALCMSPAAIAEILTLKNAKSSNISKSMIISLRTLSVLAIFGYIAYYIWDDKYN